MQGGISIQEVFVTKKKMRGGGKQWLKGKEKEMLNSRKETI